MGGRVEDDASRLAEVSRAASAIVRAERIVRTYPPGNELRERTLRELRAQLAAALPLELRVQRTCFALGEQKIVEEGRGQSDLAARLYRDGVRCLGFDAELADEELSRLLVTLATPIHPDDLSEDYVTRLWSAELRGVRVVAVDPYLALDVPDQVLEGKEVPGGEVEGVELPEATLDESREEDAVPPPPDEAFEISRADAERIAQEVAHAESTPPWENFTGALFDLLLSTVDEARIEELNVLMEATFQRLLDDAKLELAGAMLERLQRSATPACEAALRRTVERITAAERLEPVRLALEAGASTPQAARAFLAALGPRAPRLCCAFLARSSDPAAQRFFVQTLVELGAAAVDPVLALFQQAPVALQRNLARILAGVRDPRVTRTLMVALSNPDAGLRREALRSLAALRDSTALGSIMKAALGDPDGSVRLVALRVLGQARAELDCSEILRVLDSSRFQSLGSDEKDLLFETLGAIGGAPALEYLRRRLRPSWIPGRNDAEDWQRAASALAALGTEPALAALTEGAGNRRRALAAICARALQEARRSDAG